MSRKPILVCAGFFPDRHGTLIRELSHRFDLRYLDGAGRVDESQRVPVIHVDPTQAELQAALRELDAVMEEARAAAGIAPPAGREEALRCLAETWLHGRNIALSLERFHRAQGVHAVLVVNDHLGPNRSLVEEARRLGIPSFYVEHGFQMCGIEGRHFRLPRQKTLPVTDFVFVENELDRAYYEEFFALHGGRIPQVRCTGSPLDSKSVVAVSAPASKTGDRSLVLFCPGWGEGNTLQWILEWDLYEHRAFAEFCGAMKKLEKEFPDRKFEIVVKLHPTLTKSIGSDTGDYYRENAAAFGLRCEVSDGPIGEWLAGADLQVSTMPSSVQWESFLHAVPSAAYMGRAWETMLKDFPAGIDTLTTRWGAQALLWDGADWAGTFSGLLKKKWSGEIARIRAEKLRGIEQVPATEAARRIAETILNPAAQVAAPAIEGGKKMRILQIIHAFPPENIGGTELYTLSFVKAMKKLGHEVEVLYPVFEPAAEPFAFLPGEFEGVKLHRFNAVDRLPPPYSEMWGNRHDAAFRSFLARNKFDVCHFQHLIFLSPNWPAIAREAGMKTALKIDDMYFTCMRVHLNRPDGSYCSGPESIDKCVQCNHAAGKETPKTEAWGYYLLAHRRKILRDTFAGFDFVHSASRFLVDHFHAFGFDNRNFRHITTGINPFPTAPKIPSPDGRTRVAFVGHVDRRKGIIVFLDAVEKFLAKGGGDRIAFHVHGASGGDTVLINEFQKRMLALKVVTYHGPFSAADRPRIFAGIDVLVAPSQGENYPFVLREAVSAGVAVAATRIAGVPEIVKPGVNGYLFEPNDSNGLAQVFEQIARPGSLSSFSFPGSPIKLIDEDAAEMTAIFSAMKGGSALGGPASGVAAPAGAGALDVVVMAGEQEVDWKGFLGRLKEQATRNLSVTVVAPASGHGGLEGLPGVRVLRAADDRAAASALRQAVLGNASAGEVVLTEPTVRPPKGWDDNLLARIGGGVAAVGPVSDKASGKQYRKGGEGGAGTLETDWLVGLMMCLSRGAIASLDMDLESWEPHSVALRLSRAIKQKGGRMLVATDVFAGDWSAVDGVAEKVR